MVLRRFRQSRVAFVSPRVLAVLPSSSPPGENTVGSEHSLTVLSEQEFDWLQFSVTPTPKKARSSVSWRQTKRRERRAALKFWVQAAAAHYHPRTALPCKFSGRSGQLHLGRSKRSGLPATSGPSVPSHMAFEVKGPAVAPSARVSSACCSNVALEKRFMWRMSSRTRREKSGCRVRPRKEIPVLNIWRRSRKAINRELHALKGNTSAPVAASPTRNVFRRNDDDLDASLAPTVVVPPTPALLADQVFMSNAQPFLDTTDDDDMDALFPVLVVGAPTSVHQRTEIQDRLASLFARAGAGKHTRSA